jgi:predicted amidophosphoribosyltransferase
MVGWRDEVVGRLVHDFKYESSRNIGMVLAELFDAVLPEIGGDVFVVPLPTALRHIRLRGFDHTLLIARRLAKLRQYKVSRLLVREKDTVQVGANREARMVQAPNAYRVEGKIRPDATYLLIDDVWTTGSSMKAAIKKLQHTGASKITVGILAVNRVAK